MLIFETKIRRRMFRRPATSGGSCTGELGLRSRSGNVVNAMQWEFEGGNLRRCVGILIVLLHVLFRTPIVHRVWEYSWGSSESFLGLGSTRNISDGSSGGGLLVEQVNYLWGRRVATKITWEHPGLPAFSVLFCGTRNR